MLKGMKMSLWLQRPGWYYAFYARGKQYKGYAGPLSREDTYQAMAEKRAEIDHRGTDHQQRDGEGE
jgi:hypothetical protein